MLLAAAALLLAQSPPPRCSAFAARADEPIRISTRLVAPEELGVRRAEVARAARRGPGVPPGFRVGRLTYGGHGIAIRSADPRLREIVLNAPEGVHHPCGYLVDAPGSWNARDPNRSSWTVKFRRAPGPLEASRGFTAAARRGAAPVLAGYTAGATWPVHTAGKDFFVGLMHPAKRSRETLIVAFADEPRPSPARILARLPLRFQGLSVTPGLHTPTSALNLEGFDGGVWRRVALEITDATALAAGASSNN